MNEWLIEIAKLVGGGIASVGLWQFLAALVKRRTPAERLQAGVMTWGEQLQEDAQAARKDAEAARKAAREAEQIHARIRDDAERLHRVLTWVLAQIHDPNMTIDRLRATVPATITPLAGGRDT